MMGSVFHKATTRFHDPSRWLMFGLPITSICQSSSALPIKVAMFCGGLYHQQLDEAKKSHADVLICGYLWFNSPFLIMFVDMTMIFLSDIQIIVQ